MVNMQTVAVADSQGYVDKQWCNRRAMRNAEKVIQLEEAMFNWRSRHLILVLTLAYRPEFHQVVTIDTIRQHRDRFFSNRQGNKLLAGIDGYVWKIEEGSHSGGLHMHVTIFYSSEHRADIHFTRCFGEYWANDITQGMGDYWNSNADKDWHATFGHGIGTGQIDRHHLAKREALRTNLLYLAKDDQHVSKGSNPHLRMFGTSHFPT